MTTATEYDNFTLAHRCRGRVVHTITEIPRAIPATACPVHSFRSLLKDLATICVTGAKPRALRRNNTTSLVMLAQAGIHKPLDINGFPPFAGMTAMGWEQALHPKMPGHLPQLR